MREEVSRATAGAGGAILLTEDIVAGAVDADSNDSELEPGAVSLDLD